MPDFTCKGCELRHPGCHGSCEKYQAEKKAHDEIMEAKRKYYDLQANLDRQHNKSVRRSLKKNRRKTQ